MRSTSEKSTNTMDERTIQTRWYPYWHPSRHSAESLARAPPTIDSCREGDAALRKWSFFVYYESIKWDLKIKPKYECRCDERLLRFLVVYFQQNKKKAEAECKNCHATNYVKSRKADITSMRKSPHVPFSQITEEKRRGKELEVV